ncbi:MAG: hypothetical protein B6U89_04520 [Desulfurococcales archaeon ex4484_58]|nr:MAG: hypothetical protein B6U89_04520 [Desulfurococcales archaeon ex4484_58]
MRIVFVSEDGLPDFRVEKMMNTLSNLFDEIHFIGEFNGFSDFKLEKQPVIHNIKWGRSVNLFLEPYYSWTKRRVRKILKHINPDLVIAVNLVSASMLDDQGIPVIMDYHEVWSLLLNYIEPPTFSRKIVHIFKKIKYPKIEEEMVKKYPTITFSKYVAKYFMEKYGVRDMIVVKNFPSCKEYGKIAFRELSCDKILFAYIGKKTLRFDGQTYRDIRPTLEALDKLWRNNRNFQVLVAGLRESTLPFIKPLGWLKHVELYDAISRAHVGILSYKPSPIQYLVDPNKAYIYMHSGAVPVITSTHKELLETINNKAFIVDADNYEESLVKTYNEILEMDCSLLNSFRREVLDYARENLVWEKQDNMIVDFVKRHI